MFFLRKIRSLFKVLNSALSPNQVAAGFAFGVVAGFPPIGLHSLMLFLLALLFNISFSAMLLAFALFKLFSWILFPLSFEVGRFVLNGVPALEPAWTAILNLPVLALLEYNHYVVLGSYLLALVFAIPSFLLVRKFVQKYRTSFFEFLESKKSYQSLQRNERIHKVFQWLVMGGGAKFGEPNEGLAFFQVVRKKALILVPIAVGLILLVIAGLSAVFIDRVVLGASSYVIGGEVSAQRVGLNPWTGRLQLSGLSVQDPNVETQNVLQVGELVADVSYLDLLTRRFVFDEVAINEISFNIRREEDGSLNIDDVAVARSEDGTPTEDSIDLTSYFDWLRENAHHVDWIKLIIRYIGARIDAFEAREEAKLEEAYLSQYKPIDSPLPFFAVNRVRVERIQIVLEDHYRQEGPLPQITMLDVILEDFELPVSKAQEPVKIGLRAHLNDQTDSFVEFTALLDSRVEPRIEEYTFRAERIDLAPMSPLIDSTLPVGIAAGLAFASAKVRSEGEQRHAENEVRIEGLELRDSSGNIEGGSFLGLTSEITASTIAGINRYSRVCPIEIGFTLDGTEADLNAQWSREVLKIARQGLIMEGGRRVSEEVLKIDEQLGSLGDQLGDIASHVDPIGDILGSLFGSGNGEPAQCMIQDEDQ